MISLPVLCQSPGDSVIIYIENRVELTIAVPNYAELRTSNKVTTALTTFQTMLGDLEDQLSPSASELVTYTVDSSVTIKPGDSEYTYLMTQGTLRNTGFRDQAVISGDNFKLFITSVDLLNLQRMPLETCVNQVIEALPASSNMSRSLYYQCVDREVLELKSKHQTNGRIDFLEIGLTAGGGLVKNNWVTDLSLTLGLGFTEKGVVKHQPYISSDLIFDFNESGDIDLNMFLSIGYRPNIVKDRSKSNLLGIDLGYLVVDQGDLFEGTTFRLGINWSPLKGVFVGPRLYATDDFNRVFPGIRIGFGF